MKLAIFVGLITFLLAGPAQAAQFEVFSEVIAGGATRISILFNSEGEKVNTLAATLQLPAGPLAAIEIDDSHSIINFWIEPPQLKDDRLIFSGIIPGGFEGVFGSTGRLTSGRLFSILVPRDAHLGELEIVEAVAFLHEPEAPRAEVSPLLAEAELLGYDIDLPPTDGGQGASRDWPWLWLAVSLGLLVIWFLLKYLLVKK